jgi:hypothetical protein
MTELYLTFFSILLIFVSHSSIHAATEGDGLPLIDCNEFCEFKGLWDIASRTKIGRINLTSPVFKISFDYNIQPWLGDWGGVTGDNWRGIVFGHILDIVPDARGISLFTFGLNPSTATPTVMHNGVKVTDENSQIYRPPEMWLRLPEYPNDFFTYSVEVGETYMIFNNDFNYAEYRFIPVNIKRPSNEYLIYASRPDSGTVNGTIRDIRIEASATHTPTIRPTSFAPSGPSETPTAAPTIFPTFAPLCCLNGNYTGSWKDCSDAKSPTLGQPVDCDTCVAYSCIDWTIGSEGMNNAEKDLQDYERTDVQLAVGSYGFTMENAGKCFRVSRDNSNRDIIMQVISTSETIEDQHDVFVQVADGGLEYETEACTRQGSFLPMWLGGEVDWGEPINGWDTKEECQNLPEYPICGRSKRDNLQEMCEWSIDHNYHIDSTVTMICEVKCPLELMDLTGFQRTDTVPTGYQCKNQDYDNFDPSLNPKLKPTMDCSKPIFGWTGAIDNVKDQFGATFAEDRDIVVPCRRDGYTRINSDPTMVPTSMPSPRPTGGPSSVPSFITQPSSRPSSSPSGQPTSGPTKLNLSPTLQPTSKAQLPGAGNTGPSSDVVSNVKSDPMATLGSPVGIAVLSILALMLVVFIVVSFCECLLGKRTRAEREVRVVARRESEMKREEADDLLEENLLDEEDFSTVDGDSDSYDGSQFLNRDFSRSGASMI